MAMIRTAVKRRVTVSMIYLAVVIYGVVGFRSIPIDLLPDIEMPMIAVITTWPGATAEDVEENVTNPMEEQLGMIPHLDELTSVSMENLSAINLNFEYGTDLDEAANQIRDTFNMSGLFLPEEANDPMMIRMSTSFIPVAVLGVLSQSGDIHRYTNLIDDRVAGRLRRLPGVAAVIAINTPTTEIHVDVDPIALANRNLTLSTVSDALLAANLVVPLGTLQVSSMEYALRFPGSFENLSQIEEVVVGGGSGGEPIRLAEVASVSFGTADTTEVSEVNGRNAALLMVLKQSGENTVKIAQAVTDEIDGINRTLPEDLELSMLIDTSIQIRELIDNLLQALMLGGLLVFLVVLLFIQRVGPSFIIALSIPSSLLFTTLLMYLFGYTLNFITLLALVLSIGMLVDNGIVVLEHIVSQIEKGMPPIQAAMKAPYEVAAAVLASSMTTIAIFAPLIFISGMVGVMFKELGVVMIAALGSSLVAGLLLTPMLAGWWLHGVHGSRLDRAATQMRKVTLAPLRLLTRIYCAVLGWSIRHKLTVLALVAVVVVFTVWMVRDVKIDFTAKMDSQQVNLVVSLPRGTDVSKTADIGRRIIDLLAAQPEVTTYFLRAGQSAEGMTTAFGGQEGSHIVEVAAILVPLEERDRFDHEIAESIRQVVLTWPEVVSAVVPGGGMEQMFGGGRAVQVRTVGQNMQDLRAVNEQVLAMMESIDGLISPASVSFDSRPELVVQPDRERASTLGVPVAMTGAALRTALVGSTATRIQYAGDDVPIQVRYAEEYRNQVEDLPRIEIPTVLGGMAPLSAFTRLAETSSLLAIRHFDRSRIAVADADVFGRPLGDIITDLNSNLDQMQVPPGIHVELGGTIELQQEMLEDLTLLLILAVLLVFMVMAALFESLIDPLVIMVSVPFAFTGSFLFLMATGTVLSMFSMIGLIILVGIVVNNAIVLVDYINLLRSRGYEVNEAILAAGRSRIRPVLMTALTTIMGMVPLATSTGQGAQLWQPIGLAVIGGMVVSTMVTLILVPLVYRLVEPFRVYKRRKWAQEQEEAQQMAKEGAL
ncbi:MAG: efflux RND transporter permease subunit [Bradymonadales bacterium]|nr:efflux RND transporter permease subunit [Bradymonadales bacterium]